MASVFAFLVQSFFVMLVVVAILLVTAGLKGKVLEKAAGVPWYYIFVPGVGSYFQWQAYAGMGWIFAAAYVFEALFLLKNYYFMLVTCPINLLLGIRVTKSFGKSAAFGVVIAFLQPIGYALLLTQHCEYKPLKPIDFQHFSLSNVLGETE